MWDEVLKQINSKITPQKAIICWGGDPHTLKLVSTGINWVYRFKRKNQVCYLKITHKQLRLLKELEAALAFQQYLQQHNIPVCPLVSSLNDRLIEPIQQDKYTFLAQVCVSVPGKPISFDHATKLYRYWGRSLGLLHLAATSYPCKPFHYERWENDIAELVAYAENETSIIQKELATVISYLHKHPQTTENYGLIHGNHRKANVLTDGKYVYFIDFDLPRFRYIPIALENAKLHFQVLSLRDEDFQGENRDSLLE